MWSWAAFYATFTTLVQDALTFFLTPSVGFRMSRRDFMDLGLAPIYDNVCIPLGPEVKGKGYMHQLPPMYFSHHLVPTWIFHTGHDLREWNPLKPPLISRPQDVRNWTGNVTIRG